MIRFYNRDRELLIPNYRWDAGPPVASAGRKVGDFQCLLLDCDTKAVEAAVKGGGGRNGIGIAHPDAWDSTDTPDCPHGVGIEITETSCAGPITIVFECFRWHTWDSYGNTVKVTGEYVCLKS